MSYVTVGRENSAAIRIYYEDHGEGAPVVLVHGYLLDGHSWEKQEMALLAAGYRVITYDRRGFGASSRPSVGYNYDTLAADLAVLLDQLDLREVVLAGFCAGTGEVTRYLGTYGHGRVRAAVLLAPLPPFLPRAGDNPGGVDRGVLSAFITRIGADRPAAAKTFLDLSYNIDLLGGVRVSDQAWQNSFHVAIGASAVAVSGCAAAWLEDFRGDLHLAGAVNMRIPRRRPRAPAWRQTTTVPGSEGDRRHGYPAQHRPRPRRMGRRLMLEQRHRAPAGRRLPRHRTPVPDDRAGR
jgi:non-heme chloroperoxidase